MGCNRDLGCHILARNTYPTIKSGIDASISTLSSQIKEITNTLDELQIPEDYLGSKVKERIKNISNNFQDYLNDLSSEKTSVDNFIETKISEHESHYLLWINNRNVKRKNNQLVGVQHELQ